MTEGRAGVRFLGRGATQKGGKGCTQAGEWWTRIRLEVLRGEISKRRILRRESIHWETLKKILQYPEPPGYRSKTPRLRPSSGPFLSASVKP